MNEPSQMKNPEDFIIGQRVSYTTIPGYVGTVLEIHNDGIRVRWDEGLYTYAGQTGFFFPEYLHELSTPDV